MLRSFYQFYRVSWVRRPWDISSTAFQFHDISYRSILHEYFNPFVFWYYIMGISTNQQRIDFFAGYLRLAMFHPFHTHFTRIQKNWCTIVKFHEIPAFCVRLHIFVYTPDTMSEYMPNTVFSKTKYIYIYIIYINQSLDLCQMESQHLYRKICQTSPHSMQMCESEDILQMLCVCFSKIAIEHLGPGKGNCPYSPFPVLRIKLMTNLSGQIINCRVWSCVDSHVDQGLVAGCFVGF